MSKIKTQFPDNIYNILHSYVSNRNYLLKYREEYISLYPRYMALFGVPSVLGPILYLLYTADVPTAANTMTATFADDTTVLATHKDPIIASNILQNYLYQIQL